MLIVNISSILGILPPEAVRLSGKEMDTAMQRLDGSAWLLVDGEHISAFGSMSGLKTEDLTGRHIVDARGGMLLPSFCDSHTHIVYAGSRDGEYLDKIRGLSYEEIARRGGGILNSADLLHRTSEDELYRQARIRLDEVTAKGTGAIEIKSGYGLTVADELKMLRVIARLKQESPAVVRSTFLGAHAVGRAYTGRQSEYVDLVINDMLPAVAAEGLAEFVDVFCDEGFFTVDETARILDAAARYGIRPKIHACELANSGGVQIGVSRGALSVDHLERMEQPEIDSLHGSGTIATMLPGASFFLGIPFAPARRAVDSGLAVALASDYNPGSSPSGDMRMVMALGCIRMRLTPAEALAACTVNGAAAMDVAGTCGAITPGRLANFIITRPIPSDAFITYAYTTPFISEVYLRGKKVS